MTVDRATDAESNESIEVTPLIVGVDFTADTLRIALAELGGHMRQREEYPLPALEDEAAWAWEVGGHISTAFAREGGTCFALAIGVACPGPVEPIAGRMLESDGQEAWTGLAVVEALRRHFDAPVVAIERTRAALRGETMGGAAEGAHHVLYVALGAHPRAAMMVSGRVLEGGAHRAGDLPMLADLDPDVPLAGEQLETVTEVLTDAAALLDPALVVLHGPDHHVEPLGPVLQAVLDEIVPGVRVVRSPLGDGAALLGALQAAAVVAYEGERTAEDDGA
jgi:predicted NBD/HSP70 family sugar kinase